MGTNEEHSAGESPETRGATAEVTSPEVVQEPAVVQPAVSVPAIALADAYRLRQKQRRFERMIMAGVGIAVLAFCIAVYATKGRFLKVVTDAVNAFESSDANASRNRAENCLNPKNRSLPYCQDRVSESESDWRSIERHQQGRSNPFPLGQR